MDSPQGSIGEIVNIVERKTIVAAACIMITNVCIDKSGVDYDEVRFMLASTVLSMLGNTGITMDSFLKELSKGHTALHGEGASKSTHKQNAPAPDTKH